MNFPFSFKWDLKKNPILTKKRVPKTKNGPLFGEKCKSKVPNFHSVGIHVQKPCICEKPGGWIPALGRERVKLKRYKKVCLWFRKCHDMSELDVELLTSYFPEKCIRTYMVYIYTFTHKRRICNIYIYMAICNICANPTPNNFVRRVPMRG